MNASTATASSALPAGTRLGEFEITGVVGEGGFGIVYSARDSSLDRIVAVKEYLPAAFASRNVDGVVGIRSEAHGDTFQAGLSSFINEARMLAKFSHPGLVEVFRFWEANGTAYMAMRYYRGLTLREMVRTNPAVVTEQWLCETLDPILLALQELHHEKCYHRDVAPDNILVLPNGRSVLMDFGAARRIIGGMTRALTTVLKPGYAPIEQYSDDGSMAQGAWTDIYAVGGVLYHAMTGKVPVQAISRMMNDPLKPVGSIARTLFSPNLCDVVMKCLAVMPENRYQSIDELRAALGWVTTPVSSTVMLPRPSPAAMPNDLAKSVSNPTVASLKGSTIAATVFPTGLAAKAPSSSSQDARPLDLLTGISHEGDGRDPLASLLGAGMDGPSSPGVTPTRSRAAISTSPLTEKTTTPSTLETVKTEKAGGRNGIPVAIVVVAVLAVIVSAAYLVLSRDTGKVSAAVEPTFSVSTPPAQVTPIESPKAPVVNDSATKAESVASPLPTPAPVAVDPATIEPRVNVPITSASAAETKSQDDQTDPAKASLTNTGRVDLRIKPWGYVAVDGAAKVSTPPTMQLKLTAGIHEIEITNPAGASVKKSVEVIAGKAVTVRHNF